MGLTINLNADVGEGCGEDEALFESVRSASIACGFHAGGPQTMFRTVRAAKARGVSIGAHPGFDDKANFGRREITMDPIEVEAMVAYQIGALQAVAAAAEAVVTHVKAHGALYNMAARDIGYARAIARAVRAADPRLVVVAPSRSEMERAARRLGLACAFEAFPDRGYGDDGQLLPRGHPGAVVTDREEVAARAVAMVAAGEVTTVAGHKVAVAADTLCIHGDVPGAAETARAVRHALEQAGIAVLPIPALAL